MNIKKRYLLLALTVALGLGATVLFANRKKPLVVLVQPMNHAQQVGEKTPISVKVTNLAGGGIDETTLTADNIFLTEGQTGVQVAVSVKKTSANIITLMPAVSLKLNTAYVLKITNGVKDLSGASFAPFTSNFTTASVATGELRNVKFEKTTLPNAAGQYTSLDIGPDGKLYALTLDGLIKRFGINTDGTLQDPELLYALQDAYGSRQKRMAVGLVFDPASTATNLVAYVTHDSYIMYDGPDWDGRLSRLSGPNLQAVQDVLINLPRSAKDHLTNSLAFGPDGVLYFNQGSTTAMGRADKTWDLRDEHLLSGAVLRLDLKLLHTLPLNVKTKEAGGPYDPYASDAPLTVYATGLRNAYDLVWHSNGELYVPTNGSSSGGNTPSAVAGMAQANGKTYKGPGVPALTNVQQSQRDFLFRVEKGGYYGHPNPVRGEYVMNGGNPTADDDPAQVDAYPVGTKPDPNWRGFAFDFGDHKSPDGVIEYKSNAFGGALKGKLLVVRYSNSNDIIVLTPGGPHHDIVSYSDGAAIEGMSGFVLPLDLTEDTRNGNIYVAEFGTQKLTLLRPKK